ncbi:hypothetical protein ACLOJK_010912 [Asimina triloba]
MEEEHQQKGDGDLRLDFGRIEAGRRVSADDLRPRNGARGRDLKQEKKGGVGLQSRKCVGRYVTPSSPFLNLSPRRREQLGGMLLAAIVTLTCHMSHVTFHPCGISAVLYRLNPKWIVKYF